MLILFRLNSTDVYVLPPYVRLTLSQTLYRTRKGNVKSGRKMFHSKDKEERECVL